MAQDLLGNEIQFKLSDDPALDEDNVDWDKLEPAPKIPALVAENEPSTAILFRWTTMQTDPTPYKVFSPELIPQETYISIDIPNKFIISSTLNDQNYSTETVLTPAGLAYAMAEIARAIKTQYDILTNE